MTMKQLNKNNTKDEFIKAYNEARLLVEELQQQISNPQATSAQNKAAATVTEATNLADVDIATKITELQKIIGTSLADISLKVAEQLKHFSSLEEAIALKEAEVKELFGIEREANTLVALVNANKQVALDFEKSFTERKLVAEQELANLRALLAQERKDHAAQLKSDHDAITKENKRLEEEWKYDFERTKKTENDKWEDEKATREKTLAEKEELVEDKLADVVEKEGYIKELETKVKEIPSLEKAAKEEGFKEGKDTAAKAHVFETRAIESKYNSQIAILENKIELLEATAKKQDSENEQLKKDLKDAYAKVQETATSAVNAQATAQARMVSSIESMSKDSANRGQK